MAPGYPFPYTSSLVPEFSCRPEGYEEGTFDHLKSEARWFQQDQSVGRDEMLQQPQFNVESTPLAEKMRKIGMTPQTHSNLNKYLSPKLQNRKLGPQQNNILSQFRR